MQNRGLCGQLGCALIRRSMRDRVWSWDETLLLLADRWRAAVPLIGPCGVVLCFGAGDVWRRRSQLGPGPRAGSGVAAPLACPPPMGLDHAGSSMAVGKRRVLQ